MVENPRSHFAVLGDRVIRRSIKTRQSLTSSGRDISAMAPNSRPKYNCWFGTERTFPGDDFIMEKGPCF